MLGRVGEPLSPSDHVGYLHLPVIHNVGEVVSGPSISLADDEVIEFIGSHFSKYLISERVHLKLPDIRFDPDHIFVPISDFGLDFPC